MHLRHTNEAVLDRGRFSNTLGGPVHGAGLSFHHDALVMGQARHNVILFVTSLVWMILGHFSQRDSLVHSQKRGSTPGADRSEYFKVIRHLHGLMHTSSWLSCFQSGLHTQDGTRHAVHSTMSKRRFRAESSLFSSTLLPISLLMDVRCVCFEEKASQHSLAVPTAFTLTSLEVV